MEMKSSIGRYWLLDAIRGLCLVSMILYHAVYDLVAIFGLHLPWFYQSAGYIWQQSICWTFILLSGFCWSLGRKPLKRGILVLTCGGLISVVTFLFMPQQRVLFGVLTFLGTAMILMALLDGFTKKVPPLLGLFSSMLLFTVTRNVNQGEFGFEGLKLFSLPGQIPDSVFLEWLGFPSAGFFSADYFSLVPWFFLYLIGYFLWRWLGEKEAAIRLFTCRVPVLSWVGKWTLPVYMVHQPVLLALLTVGMELAG